MNFIEDTIFPHGSDSLGKECNIALKTSPKGSKTTFLPIKLQQSIIQAAMYAASDFSVSRHHRHSRQGILPPKKKRLRSFFSPLQEQGFYAAKTESCCIKHTLLFAPAQINPSAKDGSRVPQKRTIHASKASAYRLDAKLLSLVSKLLIFYGATNTQIDATSTQLAKRVETRG